MPTPTQNSYMELYAETNNRIDPLAASSGFEATVNVKDAKGAAHTVPCGADGATPINPWTNPHGRAFKTASEVTLAEALRSA